MFTRGRTHSVIPGLPQPFIQAHRESGPAVSLPAPCINSCCRRLPVAQLIAASDGLDNFDHACAQPGIRQPAGACTHIVDHVVHEPWGCHPSFAQGYYDRDNDFYVNWDKVSRDPKTYADWLEEFVYSCKNHSDYMKKLGSKTMERLKAKSRMCEGVDYGY